MTVSMMLKPEIEEFCRGVGAEHEREFMMLLRMEHNRSGGKVDVLRGIETYRKMNRVIRKGGNGA